MPEDSVIGIRLSLLANVNKKNVPQMDSRARLQSN